MDQERVTFILEALAHGIDPITGEILPEEAPYNHPEVIRALFTVLRETDTKKSAQPNKSLKADKPPKKTIEEKQLENLESGRPRNYGLAWSEEHIQQVIADFQANKTIAEIALAQERKPTSIIGILRKHEVITEEQAFVLGAKYR
jgi:hypothetical protein